jgi:hypothetical protein
MQHETERKGMSESTYKVIGKIIVVAYILWWVWLLFIKEDVVADMSHEDYGDYGQQSYYR